ncbi:MAG: hypothetical protein IPO22_23950 [Anaerolineales bacterium]|nr:hypothetical protein [Anaerolineales bacterium]
MLGRLTKANVEEIADAMGVALGWSVEQKTAEAERTLRCWLTGTGLIVMR